MQVNFACKLARNSKEWVVFCRVGGLNQYREGGGKCLMIVQKGWNSLTRTCSWDKGFRHELLVTGFHELRLEGLSIVLQPEMEIFCQSSVQGQYVCW